jgi:hypothetical protein
MYQKYWVVLTDTGLRILSNMDDYDVIIIVVLACVAAVHQLITACTILFDDVPTAREKRIMDSENFSYSALESLESLFRNHY